LYHLLSSSDNSGPAAHRTDARDDGGSDMSSHDDTGYYSRDNGDRNGRSRTPDIKKVLYYQLMDLPNASSLTAFFYA
jgi:hypothetical protein